MKSQKQEKVRLNEFQLTMLILGGLSAFTAILSASVMMFETLVILAGFFVILAYVSIRFDELGRKVEGGK